MAWLRIVELLRCREMIAMNSADASPCILVREERSRRANKARAEQGRRGVKPTRTTLTKNK